MGKFPSSNPVTQSATGDAEYKTDRSITQRSQPVSPDSCPFLMQTIQSVVLYDKTGGTTDDSPAPTRSCHATTTPFTPSTVHQSSCCLNPGNFARCPYYVEATGEQKRQLELQTRRHSVTDRLRKRIARLLPFGRTEHKKRKRVYFVI